MPHFDYCDFLLTSESKKLNRKLQITQNACVRFIFDLRKYDHASDAYSKISMLPIQPRRKLHSLLILFLKY